MKFILYILPVLYLIQPVYSQVEDEIWALEEDYISYFNEANHSAILSLYHQKFLGWPDSELRPAGKKRAAEFLREKYPAASAIKLKLKQKGIVILDNIVITHYIVISAARDDNGKEREDQTRITHTWIKEDQEWKIIGGMSNRK